MNDPAWYIQQSSASLARLMPRLTARFGTQVDAAQWQEYLTRLQEHFPRLFRLLHRLYGHHYDFFFHLEEILSSATQRWVERSDELKALDATRAVDPAWFQSHRMVGAMCYVDLFAGDITGLRGRIPYLTELGITYLPVTF